MTDTSHTSHTSIVPKVSEADAKLALALAQDDYKNATPEQKAIALLARCQALGVDPRTAPFIFITTNGATKLYATAACLEQIAKRERVTVVVTKQYEKDGLYFVEGYAESPDGRRTTDVAVLPLPAGNEARANAIMKAHTKFHRRVVKKHCGLGALLLADETLESVVDEVNPRGKYWQLHNALGLPAHDDESGGRERNHAAWSAILGREVTTGTAFTTADWAVLHNYISRFASGDAECPLPAAWSESAPTHADAHDKPDGEAEDLGNVQEVEVTEDEIAAIVRSGWTSSEAEALDIARMLLEHFGEAQAELAARKLIQHDRPGSPVEWVRMKLAQRRGES